MKHSSFARALWTLTGAAAAALAPTPAASQQLAKFACYVPGSGTVYRIKEPKTPSRCSAGHVEFQIAAASDIAAANVDVQKKPGGGGGTGTTAGGDLAGTYPNPTVVKIQGQPVSSTAPSAGQVLTFNNGAWSAQAPAAASLPTNAWGAFDLSNSNGVVSLGSIGTGSIPYEGVGTRFMWYPGKAALRVGSVSGSEWDNANIGVRSIALGHDVTASGLNAFAVGLGAKATGEHAVALGIGTIAGNVGATALGSGSKALSNVATAMGLNTTAAGLYSTAMGNGTTASGEAATATGHATTASGSRSTAMGSAASTALMSGAFVYGDNSTSAVIQASATNQFVVRAQRIWFGTNNAVTATVGRYIETSTGAYLSTGGTWTNSSDSTRKHDFRHVDGEDVLAKIAAMPVTTWSYRDEATAVRHMGPTAQDFRRAFGLGDTDKAIATVDADGVALAAIKGLVERTAVLRAENDELRAALVDLSRRLVELESSRR